MKSSSPYNNLQKLVLTGDYFSERLDVVTRLNEYFSFAANNSLRYAIRLLEDTASFSFQPDNINRRIRYCVLPDQSENLDESRLADFVAIIVDQQPGIIICSVDPGQANVRFNGLWGDLERSFEICKSHHVHPFFLLRDLDRTLSEYTRTWLAAKGCSLHTYFYRLSFERKKLPAYLVEQESELLLLSANAVKDFSYFNNLKLEQFRQFNKMFYCHSARNDLIASLAQRILLVLVRLDTRNDYIFENIPSFNS
ncbi:MAG: hypothetical protein JNK27_11790 [Chitinophagaceae bacterium]|nr:hypothetical protein [Chitinophagaceae bacterium]